MLIDWFTIIAQIVNFLILVALLKSFLYKPILKAMEQREKRIASRLIEAKAMVEEANREAELYRHKQQNLEEQKEAWLAFAKQQVEHKRQLMLQQTTQEVEKVRSQWYEALAREKQAFLQELRQRAGKQLEMTARRVLGDLANSTLEEQIVDNFIERLYHLDNAQLQALQSSSSANPSQELVIRSTFPILPAKSEQLIKAIQEQIAKDVKVKFEQGEKPICGIELHRHGYKLAWNLEYYLTQLEAEMEQVLANGTKKL